MILYCPSASVTTDRTFSISAALEASTVTPGMTAPDVSLTTPAIPPAACADRPTGERNHADNDNANSVTPALLTILDSLRSAQTRDRRDTRRRRPDQPTSQTGSTGRGRRERCQP